MAELLVVPALLAYAAAERIRFDGMQMRTDIAARAVERVDRVEA